MHWATTLAPGLRKGTVWASRGFLEGWGVGGTMKSRCVCMRSSSLSCFIKNLIFWGCMVVKKIIWTLRLWVDFKREDAILSLLTLYKS